METKERHANVEKMPALVPNWSIFMKIKDPNLHNLTDPNNIVSIDLIVISGRLLRSHYD